MGSPWLTKGGARRPNDLTARGRRPALATPCHRGTGDRGLIKKGKGYG